MNLNHINIVVKDVEKAVHLFTQHLGFSLIVNRNSKMAVMENSNNFALVIWGQELNNKENIPEYPENFHIGFYQKDEQEVWDIYEKLKTEATLQFESEPKKIRNTFGFYFFFEKLMIEISVNPFKDNIA
ncbi:VOC family protein [Elizabethkingia meningoseptica]|uniref:VOC family protein n=1 Tax=Elizabethkingia meningoseptica TaxID=238 RepID=UPI0023B1DDC2|nr:VOC family protein [Elizabethkingia meningoseptica]MDE5437573.1 VOC family protein [Elizabethkingia meningoseptica]MDE5468021.1 VOC family protein [Elizabethkingia meningoseptica]MDE5474940.1 VOC family protein [Elizabethkingia meningoseptica]MDE5478373.1 VOC family protein [Elizabethkingia meningoseptica]MDE5486772.1 VOC family protein [Elizabethkingia meningoseptica]